MLWALTILVCLVEDSIVECRDWRVEPFATKYECQVARREALTQLEDTTHAYVYMSCEKGDYS